MAASDTGGPEEVTIDLDNPPGPEDLPGLGIGDLWKYTPAIAEIVKDVEQALSGGGFQAPAIHIRVAGKTVTFGPIPVTVS